MMVTRSKNRDMIIKKLMKSKNWNNQFNFFNPSKNLKPSWFGLPLMTNMPKKFDKKKYLQFLNKNHIETRPIISGNFTNQPAVKFHKIKFNKKELLNSQKIEEKGFFIGLPTELLSLNELNKLTKYLLCIDNF